MTATEKCPTGKIRYKTKEAANRHLTWLIQRQPAISAGRYKCRICGDWHVGHRLPGVTKRRRRD